MMRTWWSLMVAVSVLVACSSDSEKESGEDAETDDGTGDSTADSGGAGDSGDDAGDPVEPACTEPVEVACFDDLWLDLSMHDDRTNEGAVSTVADGDDFVSTLDASSGGYDRASRNAWLYVKFTDEGMSKVDIDDETALESMDWDLSLRRYIVRLNGGDSGPSCVGAAAFLESSYADLTSVPDGLPYILDDYYTSDCTLTTDSSGLPGSPSVALGAWWSYSTCVQTTEVPFLVQLADGRVVKMVIEAYYGANQDNCNNRGRPGDDSAVYTIRWRFMS